MRKDQQVAQSPCVRSRYMVVKSCSSIFCFFVCPSLTSFYRLVSSAACPKPARHLSMDHLQSIVLQDIMYMPGQCTISFQTYACLFATLCRPSAL